MRRAAVDDNSSKATPDNASKYATVSDRRSAVSSFATSVWLYRVYLVVVPDQCGEAALNLNPIRAENARFVERVSGLESYRIPLAAQPL